MPPLMVARLLFPHSNYYILGARRRIDPFVALAPRTEEWEIATCGMIVLEVTRGRSDPHLLRRFQSAFAQMIQLPATGAVWERASALAWSLDRRGLVLPAPDLLIAAIALENEATLLTFDHHFAAIPGLDAVESLP